MRDVDGLNAGYARLLLDEYLENPEAVPPEWRALFEADGGEAIAVAPGRRAAARAGRKRPAGRARERPPDRVATGARHRARGAEARA